jgi:hypothetical protein
LSDPPITPEATIDPESVPEKRSPNKWHWLGLAAIVLVAGLLRFWGLENRPPGFFRDEAEKGYNAWALATTGGMLDIPNDPAGPRMEWRRLPWMTNVFGNRTSAIYHYASVPFMWLAGPSNGPTVAATRMASAFVGTLTVLLLGALLVRAWGPWAGLAAAFWLAICPWHLLFSRWALEGIFVPLFMVVTLWGAWGIARDRRWGLPVAGAGLGWLFYSYSGAQPLALAWGACLAIIFRQRIFSRGALRSPWWWLGAAMFFLPVVPTLIVRLEPGGSERMGRIAIWNDPEIATWQVPLVFIKNYFAHLNPRFLFWAGDTQPRHCIPGFGQLTYADAILLPLGICFCLRQPRPLTWALFTALLCGPISATLTNEGIPHGLRSIGMLLPSVALSALPPALWFEWVEWETRDCSLKEGFGKAVSLTALSLILALVLFSLASGPRKEFQRAYRNAYGPEGDPRDPIASVAFEEGQRIAWEDIGRLWRPDQHVFVNGYQPYSVYYQLFFLKVPPRSIGPQGPNPERFIYYDPTRQSLGQLRSIMRPGDRLLYPADPARLSGSDGEPWISEEDARRANEPWTVLERKP